MDKRVFLFDEIVPALTERPKGGRGEMLSRMIITRGQTLAAGSPFVASGVNSILPGGAIGLHPHPEDEEVYFIISGQGDYLDNAGARHKVKSGDVMFCCKGERHGLENTGTEPLVVGAVVARA